MRTFQEECALLAPLETFDPEAFRGDAAVPQTLCNFVLTLALIYNDCKDVIYARLLLGESHPKRPVGRTRLGGAWSGIDGHIFRAIASLLHELFKVIEESPADRQHPFFVSLLSQISSGARKSWEVLVAAAAGDAPSNDLGKYLVQIRNNVLFHYGGNAIFNGYARHFLSAKKQDERAYISRGATMMESRFYFADAAAVGYLQSIVGDRDLGELMMSGADVLPPLNHALKSIVEAHIQRRRYPFRVGEAE